MTKPMKQISLAVSYAENALSFLFLDPMLLSYIDTIYLYGSAARGELTETSDIDFFISCLPEKEKEIEGAAKAAFSRFASSLDYDKWKRLGFTFPFSVHAGDFQQWELRNSILADGLLLYSKNISSLSGVRSILFIFELPKNKKKYLHFIRTFFGRKEKGYKEHGVLHELQGAKISATAVLVPKEHMQTVTEFFIKEKIFYSFKEVAILR